jgi:thymidylate synthase
MYSPARNVSFATVNGLADLMANGAEVTVRGHRTREVLHWVATLQRPLERFVFVPGRGNDPFAQIAEAVWVLAGRGDVGWLGRYLPRALDYSDDGEIWRAAYGPRLRRWHGSIDQLDRVRRLLLADPASRRAVAGLFDPEADFVDSKDVPCNNWLSWMMREGRLHLAVALRSCDAVWGFSGANAFEWSLVHEALAYWVGAQVGSQTWLASSFHVYERHWNRAATMVDTFRDITPYDHALGQPRFSTTFADLDRVLGAWFAAERSLSSDPDRPVPPLPEPADPLLSAWLGALRLKWGARGWSASRLRDELGAMPMSDATAAAWLQLAQARPELLEGIPDDGLAAYVAATARPAAVPDQSLGLAVKRLHARKDRAYGAAWKRRGEMVSVLPNIARKVDRLTTAAGLQRAEGDESLLDTAVDLYVYVLKYRLLLEERGSTGLLSHASPAPASDHDANFDELVDADDLRHANSDVAASIAEVAAIFETLWRIAGAASGLDEPRCLVDELRSEARNLVAAVALADPRGAETFVRVERSLAE